MRGRLVLDRNFARRITLSVAIGAALLLLAGVGTARADNYTKCQDKLQSAQSKLFRDVRRHGEYSSQARNDQNKLNDAQNWCSNHHVFSEQGRNFRDDRRDYNRDRRDYNRDRRDSYDRDGDAYRDPRNNGPYYNGPYR
jgi:hypothetical protein